MVQTSSGTLYIVSTPIGNREDITLRALRTLKEVSAICCEDTRHTGQLLTGYDIRKPLLSFHSHSSDHKTNEIIQRLKSRESLALVTDAGTPGISDPGWKLISACVKAHIQVTPIPGATALLTALVGSGLPMDKFVYLGFLPLKKGRQTLFKSLADEERTVVFYESPRRLLRTLEQMRTFIGHPDLCHPDRMSSRGGVSPRTTTSRSRGDRDHTSRPHTIRVVIARELTKIYEEFIRGSIDEVIATVRERGELKGECVVMMKNNFVIPTLCHPDRRSPRLSGGI